MKKILALFALLFLGTVATTNTSKAQALPFSACIHDEYGYVWNYLSVTHDGDNYSAVGTVDVGAGFLWRATGTFNTTTGATSLKAVNPQADGCNSGFTDYFEYTGTATASKTYYSGAGSWESFCSGSVINSGDWDATDCAHKGGIIKPNGPAKNATGIKTVSQMANIIAKAKAPSFGLCIHDEYGYMWNYTVSRSGADYTATGAVDVGAGFDWVATGTYNSSTGATTLTATNPQADGCQSGYVDYFMYSGTATASRTGGVVTYSGAGSWESFCSGSVINSGDWDGTDCAQKGGTIKSNGPAKHAGASLIKVSPNPINSHANISYSVVQSGKVNITVYNSMQQAVKVLVNDFKNAGNYTAVWDAKSSNVNAGIYRVVATVNGKIYTTTVQVVK